KPEAPEPAERMILVRESFSFWALIFNIFWLIAHRLWRVLALYMVAVIAVGVAGELLHLAEGLIFIAQLFLQVMLAVHAHDLQGSSLVRRGYRMVGVLAAESEMHAERRYHEYAA